MSPVFTGLSGAMAMAHLYCTTKHFHCLSNRFYNRNGKCVLEGISGVIDISKAVTSHNLWTVAWRQCHTRSIHHRVMTTPTSTIVVTFRIGNCDILGWYLWFVLVSCSLGVHPSGRISRFHHGRWGWRSSPSASNQVSSSQFLQLVKRCESGGSISQFAETFSPTFFQALKWPSSGTLRDFITWRRWIDSVQFDLSSAWTCLTWF